MNSQQVLGGGSRFWRSSLQPPGEAAHAEREATSAASQERSKAKRGPLPTAFLRVRTAPEAAHLARRRILIKFTKLLLPMGAAALLATIALWPELDRSADGNRFSLRQVSGDVEGGHIKDARYHGVDERGRPYTLTAVTAHQLDSDRVEMTTPKGDLTQENGTWLMLRADRGLYQQKADRLDLRRDVTLYRDDGTTLSTSYAEVEIKGGAAHSDQPVHVEGPFGVLDAQGFTVVEKGAAIHFAGPAKVVLNGSQP